MADDATTTVDPAVEAADQILAAAADSVTESGAQVEELVPEAEAEQGAAAAAFSLADIPDDDLLAHLRERKDGSGLSLEDRLRKSERDRERERIRREQGSNERAQQYHAWLTEQIESGKSAEEIAKQTPTFVKANQDYVTAETARAWVETALPHFGVQEQEVLNSVLEGFIESGDVEGLKELAGKTWNAAAAKVKQSAVSDLSLSDIPADSKLHQDVQAHIQSEVEKELAAREKERVETPENPPRTPSGGAPAGIDNLDSMTPEARKAYFNSLTDDERTELWRKLAPGV